MKTEIKIPKINPNDDEVTVGKKFFNNGDSVSEGAPVIEVETSKATSELEAEASGFIYYQVNEMDKALTGSTVCIIVEDKADGEAFLEQQKKRDDDNPESLAKSNRAVTKKAQALIDEHDIPVEQLLGSGAVTEKMVRRYIDKQNPEMHGRGSEVSVNPIQISVRETLAKSRQSTYRAHLTARIFIDLTKLDDLSAQVLNIVLLVSAGALKKYPLFSEYWVDDGYRRHSTMDIGFTFNHDGNLLMLPVQDIDGMSLSDINIARTETMMNFARGKVGSAEPGEIGFSISLIESRYLEHHFPYIFPGTSGILGVAVNKNSAAGGKSSVGFCLAYDHGVVNGEYASNFMDEIIMQFEEVVNNA